ncbi:hypothetical protein V502_02486 [Pseudogymnoascus sp. VKM F-4520 (FW-2644)]|nr:hypothetical protein V502_02486 [Pseudogymnoascus sp. VKM F-4520 (FW-2644)]
MKAKTSQDVLKCMKELLEIEDIGNCRKPYLRKIIWNKCYPQQVERPATLPISTVVNETQQIERAATLPISTVVDETQQIERAATLPISPVVDETQQIKKAATLLISPVIDKEIDHTIQFILQILLTINVREKEFATVPLIMWADRDELTLATFVKGQFPKLKKEDSKPEQDREIAFN